jgi:hypothetical protein
VIDSPAHVKQSHLKCAQCEYDLTGTAIGGRCPECGTSVWDSIHALMPKDSVFLPPNACASVSLATALLSICIPFVGVIAIVLGVIARRQIARGHFRPSASICADVGLLLGCVSTIFCVMLLVGNLV